MILPVSPTVNASQVAMVLKRISNGRMDGMMDQQRTNELKAHAGGREEQDVLRKGPYLRPRGLRNRYLRIATEMRAADRR